MHALKRTRTHTHTNAHTHTHTQAHTLQTWYRTACRDIHQLNARTFGSYLLENFFSLLLLAEPVHSSSSLSGVTGDRQFGGCKNNFFFVVPVARNDTRISLAIESWPCITTDLGVVSTPRISIGPAGCRINRDYARRGWAAERIGVTPVWGPRDPYGGRSCH